jgi:hypothetical protein
VRDLERLLGKKTIEAEILKDAIEIARNDLVAVALRRTIPVRALSRVSGARI